MIPRVCHMYWGRNRPLSFMRYLSAFSFIDHNPGWELKIWYPKTPTQGEPWDSLEQKGPHYSGYDYFQTLRELIHTEVLQIPHEIRLEGLPEVIQSDLLRWYLLSVWGGVWADFDIFWVAPVDPMVPSGADAVVCCHEWNSIGFLASAHGGGADRFWGTVLNAAQAGLQPDQYQSAGRRALDICLPPGGVDLVRSQYGVSIHNLPMEAVYPIPYNQPGLYYRDRVPKAVDGSIGFHWFGGHPASLEAEAMFHEEGRHPAGWLPRLMLETYR